MRLFGSFSHGDAVPGSDADILILLEHDSRTFRDRLEEYLVHFSGCGVAVDVFPFTQSEFEEMHDNAFWKTAIEQSICLGKK